ncbi:ATP-binding protein [Propionivibrio dicarboxylicus]|uniref:histidine kinase n=1 Tax=Propionivibrio dicarboxylicus TaxID=83767 RepID=A0A1G7X213_9RHOO|nr:ATP-binding protein [Propionivibrio dicarboxylicus]SDG78234.1 PAS domain S-box-containing protein [Propionivibrio dicarboxylicus]
MAERRHPNQVVPLMLAPWLLVVAVMSMLLLLGGQLWLSYRDQVNTAEISAYNLAALFEARFEARLRQIDAELIALRRDISADVLRPGAVVRHRTGMNASLERRMINRDDMVGYRVVDAGGNLLYFSGALDISRMNVVDRSYFRQLREDPSDRLVISEVLAGRGVRKDVLVLARGLRNDKGDFLGVVYGSIDLGFYRRQFSALELGHYGLIALRRDDHSLVIRSPDLPGDVNTALPSEHPVVRRLALPERLTTLHYEAAPDYVPRIMSIVRMRDFPFYFAVGLGKNEVLEVWYQQVVGVVVSAAMVFTLLGVLLMRLRRAQAHQQQVLSELAVSESQFRELTQLVPVGIARFDDAGNCTYVNDRCAAIAGRNREEMTGSDWTGFVHREDRSGLPRRSMVGRILQRPYACELRFVQPGGTLAYVQVEIRAGVASDGSVQGYLAALTDITQRKRTEAELLEAKQRAENADLGKTRFLAAASHDLRQPIQAINLFLDALRRTDLSPEQKAIADFLSRSGHALSELLYSLLDLSKLDSGQIKPQPRCVELEEIFRAIDAEFSTLARQKNLRFKLFFPFAPTVLFIDTGLLMSIVRNLIDNALKYTERGGVLVGARKRRGRMVIQVWDTGVGIDPRDGDRIFEESYQVSDSVLDRSKGLGLGLTIARRMAQLLECELSYRSRPGQGSVFEVMLPAYEIPVAAAIPAIKPVASVPRGVDESLLAGWSVVVVEDDPMVAKAIELSLDEFGVSTQLYDSAERALGAQAVLAADFYLSDLNLPGMDGMAFLTAVQERRTTPVQAVLMTGEALRREIIAASSPWPVLLKPVEMVDLLAAMSVAARNGIDRQALVG